MKSNQLKIIAGKFVTESKLDKNAKLLILNFIKESSDHQVKGLLLDGEMYFNLSNDAGNMIDKRFQSIEKNILDKFEKYMRSK